MQLIPHTIPKMIISSEGKHIRKIDDVYKEEYIDEQENEIPEHIPYYTTTIFVPDNFTEEQMYENYVEEIIENS